MEFKVTYPNGTVETEHVDDPGVKDIDGYINRKFGKAPTAEGFMIEIVGEVVEEIEEFGHIVDPIKSPEPETEIKGLTEDESGE